jgi:RHS repeat-associated core domain
MTIKKGHIMKIRRLVIRAACLLGLWLGLGLQAHAQTDTVTYVYTDPQGTPLVKADASGNVIARYDYTPYGSSVASLGNPPDGPGYTGHVNDPETGLVYMQARYYQPLGRFLSPDPVAPSPGNIFGFNRYTYVNNNPITRTDPDGRQTAAPGDGLEEEMVRRDQVDPKLYWDNAAKKAVVLLGYLMTGTNIESHNASGDDSIQSVVTPFEFAGASKLASLGDSFFAKAASADFGSSSFFSGTSYTPKVMQQMSQGPGEFHSFPESVTAFESSGTTSTITGGDGVLYQKLDIPGSYTSSSGTTYDGSFQLIKNGDGDINHRLFVPDKQPTTQ